MSSQPPPAPDPAEPAPCALPPKLYSLGTLLAAALCGLSLRWPELGAWAVGSMAALPVLGALWVTATQWKRDRPLAAAALLSVLGLAAILLGRGALTGPTGPTG